MRKYERPFSLNNNQPLSLSEKMKAKGTLREFRVIGRKLPTENEPETPLYRYVCVDLELME